MTKSIFVIGTSTDIGKTFITALITKKLRENNINAGYFKPVLSGAEIINNTLVAGDSKYVCDIANIKENPNKFVSFLFKTPVSPHLASQKEKKTVCMDKIVSDFNKLKKEYDVITVEGCGGIFCQLSMQKGNEIYLTDIIKNLKLNTLLVSSSLLGTINSTVLTVEYAKKSDINIKGIILNYYDKNNFMHTDNKKQIEFITKIPVIATVSKNTTELDIDINTIKQMYGES